MSQKIHAYVRVGLAVLLFTSLLAAPVAGQTQEKDEKEEGTVVIDLDAVVEAVQELIDEITGFTDGFDTVLEDVLIAVLFKPFRLLAQQLIQLLVLVLGNTPTLYPNPAVEEIHRLTLIVTYVLSGLVFAAAGLLHMIGPMVGISYKEVRMILPRVITALIFSTVSLPLLQYSVELSDALVIAFMPQGLTASVGQIAGLSVSLVLVWVIQSWLLLALVVVFIIRNVYLMFIAAISPLIAICWSLPKAKRYADTFISGYWAAWAMAPLDVLVLRFILTLTDPSVGSGLQGVSNWILGVAGFSLLLFIPYQLYGASQAILGQSYSFAGSVKSRVKQHRREKMWKKFRQQNDESRRIPRRRRGD